MRLPSVVACALDIRLLAHAAVLFFIWTLVYIFVKMRMDRILERGYTYILYIYIYIYILPSYIYMYIYRYIYIYR